MVCLRTSPKTPEELYEFFMYGLPLPLVKSHVAYIDGIQCIREHWVINAYLSKSVDLYSLWFRYKESDLTEWYEVYEKYLHENETTCKHR